MAHWEFLVPNLPVRDVRASQEWYRDVLGLGVNWIWEDSFGSVGRDHVELFLYESDDPRPMISSVFVDDVENVLDHARSRGADIASELELKPWGVREFSVRDPDGHLLRIGRGEQDARDRPELTVQGAA